MPDGSGRKCIEQIRGFESKKIFKIYLENNHLPNMNIFSLSGSSIENVKKEYQNLNVQEYLRKPVKMKELVNLIQSYKNS